MSELIAFWLIVFGCAALALLVAYIIIPIGWKNTAARKYLLAQANATNTPNQAMRLTVEQAVAQVFHEDIRKINSNIIADDQSWGFLNVTIDFFESKEIDPNWWKAETSYNVFMRRLERAAPEIALDQQGDVTVNPMYTYGWKIKHGELVYCEAAFMDKFRLYCHPGQEAEVLSLLAPDALVVLLDNMTGTDMYIVDRYVFCIMPSLHISRRKVRRIFENTERIVAELNTNLPRVTQE